MGNAGGRPPQGGGDQQPPGQPPQKKPKKYEPKPLTKPGGKRKKKDTAAAQQLRLPSVVPTTKCKLRLLKTERIKDFLLLEEEFLRNQELLRPKVQKEEEERLKIDELRGTPTHVGTLEEIIDDAHAIVNGFSAEYYVSILSIVDRDLLEPGTSVLLHSKSYAIVGVLADDTDPLVQTMKVEKAPLETYADIGGLEQQIMEIKEAVELPLTHPELYADIGIQPPKGGRSF